MSGVGTLGPVVIIGEGVADGNDKVGASGTDNQPDVLSSKLSEGAGIAFDLLNPGGDEELEISATGIVAVSGTDTTPDMLSAKLAEGDGVTLTVLDPAGDEQIEINTDRKFKVTADDTTPGYLWDKVDFGEGVTLSVGNPAGNEYLLVEAGGKMRVSTNDTTPAWIEDKLVAGDGVAIAVQDEGANETLEISSDPTVKVSATDSTRGYLTDKLEAGQSVTMEVVGADAAYQTVKVSVDPHDIIYSGESGEGAKIVPSAPQFAWRDIIGEIHPKTSGGNTPTAKAYIGNVSQYAFIHNDLVTCEFHMPHDYAPGSDVYLHIHWSHNASATISGTVEFTNYMSYAKGHNQANFSAEKTAAISHSTVDLATTPQYRHRIDEIQISNAGGDSTHFDRALLEPDGLLLVTTKLTIVPTMTGGSPNIFVHFVDLHYQSTNLGTYDKVPNFYFVP